jgi:hypothetical protein
MRKLVVYHLVTIIPMIVILSLYVYAIINTVVFVTLFGVYAFIYRPIIDFEKLKRKGLVKKEQFIKSLGFIRFKYFSELMLED